MVPVDNCTGCFACMICCPRDAISVVEDREGFLYPQVDSGKCNSCGYCLDKCPVQASIKKQIDPLIVYAAWTKNPDLLKESTSGGVFSEVARNVLEEGGVVFGAAYDADMSVMHIAVETLDELHKLRGSKYVQSDICSALRQATTYIKAGRQVLFSGTPCQVAGLYAAVGGGHENLLTCELICHGVPSPKVFQMAIKAIEKRKKARVENFIFREKTTSGWLYPTVKIIFENGKSIKTCNSDNPFNLGFLKNIYLRPSCYACHVKSAGSGADISLGDFWELLKYRPSLINPDGTSVIAVHTQKGKKAIQACSEILFLEECPFQFIEHDSNIRKSSKTSPVRTAFFDDLGNLSFEDLTRKYIRPRCMVKRWLAVLVRYLRVHLKKKKLQNDKDATSSANA